MEIRLRELLQEYNQDEKKFIKAMYDNYGIHRHTVRKLLNNESSHPSLEILQKITEHLVSEENVPKSEFPAALFRLRDDSLFHALANAANVVIFLGLYKHTRDRGKSPTRSPGTLAWADAEAAARIISRLSSRDLDLNKRARLQTRYTPFEFLPGAEDIENEKFFIADKKSALKTYREILRRGKERKENMIFIGSPRSNYLQEAYISTLFNCPAFEPNIETARIPFYINYRPEDWPLPSCFGGFHKPPGFEEEPRPGVYYQGKNKKWVMCEYVADKNDAGIVVIEKDSGSSGAMKIGIAGVSGYATILTAQALVAHPEKFWPEEKIINGRKEGGFATAKRKEVAVFICEIRYSQQGPKEEYSLPFAGNQNDDVNVIPLDRTVLEEFLDPKRARTE